MFWDTTYFFHSKILEIGIAVLIIVHTVFVYRYCMYGVTLILKFLIHRNNKYVVVDFIFAV